MLRRREVGRRVDGRSGLLEDPVVDRLGRAIGGHEVLQREGEASATRRRIPGHDRKQSGCLGLGQQVFELGHRLGRLGHAQLRGELLVVEDAGQAVVEAHRIQGARAARAVGPDPVLCELRGRPLVPAEGGRVVVKVLEQSILDQRNHRRKADQVRGIVARQQPRGRAHQVRELVLADLPGHIRKLLGELFRELEREIESALEVGGQLDGIGPARRAGCDRARRGRSAGACRWGGRGRRSGRCSGCCRRGRRDGTGRRASHHHDGRDGQCGDASSRLQAAGGMELTADHQHSSSVVPKRARQAIGWPHPRPSFGGAVVARTTSSGARWTTGGCSDRTPISARSTSAPRRPDSSNCWRTVVKPT